MKVYELIADLATMPAGADVSAGPDSGDGVAIDVAHAYYMGGGIVSLVLDGSYEEHIESEGDDD